MENRNQEIVLEERNLKRTIAIAEKQLQQAKETVEGKEEELKEAKRDVRENASHAMTNLYSANDFEALVELSQYMNPVAEIVADCEAEKRKITSLEKILKSPYFARIDFQFEDEEEAEKIYIGRVGLTEKNSQEIVIYDWRSPIASIFYRFMTGNAFYDAPYGRMNGEVKLKRQYEIQNGTLEYFFDTDRNISDEFLRELLSKNTSPQMKAVVETIQKEQDMVIRDMDSDLLMVQGVAGSGKTSIALHRAAYLMYQGLQSKLSANNILIVSPNDVFEEYISNVLPELGEDNVNSVVFEDILKAILPDRQIQSKNEFLEQAVTNNSYKEIVKQSMEVKTSQQFQNVLDQLLLYIPLRFIEFEDIYYNGDYIVGKEALRDWVLRRPEVALGLRLEQLEEYVLELVFGTVRKREDADARNRIRQEVQRFTKFDIVEVYSKMIRKEGYFTDLPESGCLRYEDAIAISYLYLQIYGNRDYQNIRQVVIDEAQDYYPLQYEIFRLLFPNAKFTVLGDINQTLAKRENLTFYEQVKTILGKENASLVTLNKSFRCTNEILEFGLQFIQQKPEIQSFNRAGDKIQVSTFDTDEALGEAIVKEIEVCKERGFESVCLICKTKKNSERLFEMLKTKTEVQLIRDNDIESLQGTFIMPVYMSKGLEFDSVILCDANLENYCDEDDRNLLYVASTRALHRLSVFGKGTLFLLQDVFCFDKM